MLVLLFIISVLLLIFLLKKQNIEGFQTLIDPRYNVLSYHNNKNLYTRFLDYFHYGNQSKYDYPHVHSQGLYDYPMNYIKSPFVTLNKSPFVTLNNVTYGTEFLPHTFNYPYRPIKTTIYEISKINDPQNYSYSVLDKYGNLHLLDYRSDPKLLTNENFKEQVWLNPHDKKIIFIPK